MVLKHTLHTGKDTYMKTPSAYSLRQQRYIGHFILQMDNVWSQFLKTGLPDETSAWTLGNILEQVSLASDVASAGIAIAGLATAVPTAGASVAIAASCITLVKTGAYLANEGYAFVKRQNGDNAPFSPDELERENTRLKLQTLINEVVYSAALRYKSYIENEEIEEKGIEDFAYYGAKRLLKKLAVDLKSHVTVPDTMLADDLVNYLLESTHLSMLHDTVKIPLKKNSASSLFQTTTEHYAKWAYARPRLAIYKKTGLFQLELTYYSSANEKQFIKRDTTLLNYKHATLPQLPAAMAIDTKTLTPFRFTDHKEKQQVQEHFLIYYPVSRQEVIQYLNDIRQLPEGQAIPSLNAYLSSLMNLQVIAECHDNELQGLDLQEGNFCEVNFRRANLSHCNLQNTSWEEAHIEEAIFKANPMSGANFNKANADLSQWSELTLEGQFTQTQMNGTKITNVVIGHHFSYLGSEWFLSQLENVSIFDGHTSLKQYFEERLTEEHQARLALKAEIVALSQKYVLCMQQLLTEQQLTAEQEHQIALNRMELIQLEQKLLSHFAQINYQIVDIKTKYEKLHQIITSVENKQEAIAAQLQLFKQEQLQQWQTQQMVNQEITKRIELLEPEKKLTQRLRQLREIRSKTTSFDEMKKFYIEPYVIQANKETDLPILLSDQLELFLHNNQQFLLLEDGIEMNTSFFASLWEDELLSTTNIVPILINMEQVKDTSNDNFLMASLETIFAHDEIATLMANRSCVIIYYGIDKCAFIRQRYIVEECIKLNPLWRNRSPKIIFLGPTDYFLGIDFRERLRFSSKVKFPLDLTFDLLPLMSKQIADFVGLYNTPSNNFSVQFNDYQDRVPAIRTMSQSFLMLQIICAVLHANPESHGTSRLQLYEEFFETWFRHIIQRFYSTAFVQQIHFEDFSNYIEEQAMLMFNSGEECVERVRPSKKHTSNPMGAKKAILALFDDPLLQSIRYQAPFTTALKTQGNVQIIHHQFIDPSFKYYMAAKHLLKILLSDEPDSDDESNKEMVRTTTPPTQRIEEWDKRFFTDTPDVLYFLEESLRNHPELQTAQERLLLMVFSGHEKAASNAITLLNRMKYLFIQQDFTKISIPKADLRDGVFQKCNFAFGNLTLVLFTNSDLSGSSFYRAVVFHTNMENCNLTEATFLHPLTIMYTTPPPTTFAVAPALATPLLAMDVPEQDNNQIAVFDLMNRKKITHLKGHKASIYAMAWSNGSGNNRLVTAGAGGTLRVWDMVNFNQITAFKEQNGHIFTLAWAQDGNLFAAGGMTHIIQIWNTDTRSMVAQSEPHPLNVLIWGPEGIVISGGDEGIIRFWNYTGAPKLDSVAILRNEKNPIRSLALSKEGNQLASGYQNAMIYLQNLTSNFQDLAAPLALAGHTAAVTALAYATYLASASDDATVRLWEMDSGNCVGIFQGHESNISQVAWVDDHVISGGKDSMVMQWSGSQPLPNPSAAILESAVRCFALLNGNLVTGRYDGQLDIKSINHVNAESISISGHAQSSINQVAWSLEGNHIAWLDQHQTLGIQTLHPASSTHLESSSLSPLLHMCWLPHQFLLTCTRDGTFELWSPKGLYKSNVSLFKKRVPNITSMAYCQATHQLVISTESDLILFEIQDAGKDFAFHRITENVYPTEKPTAYLSWCPDGHFLATMDREGSVTLWNSTDWTRSVLTNKASESKQLTWAYAQNQYWFVMGDSQKILIWDLTSGNFATPNQQIMLANDMLGFDSPHLIVIRKKGIFSVNFNELINMKEPNTLVPSLHFLQQDFTAQNCNLKNSFGLSAENLLYLEENGALMSTKIRASNYSNGFFFIKASHDSDLSEESSPGLKKPNSPRTFLSQTLHGSSSDAAFSDPKGIVV